MFKDLPEGQTHSYGDNCGEPAHNPMPNNELDERFKEWVEATGVFSPVASVYFECLNMIKEEIEAARKDERRKTVVEVINKFEKALENTDVDVNIFRINQLMTKYLEEK